MSSARTSGDTVDLAVVGAGSAGFSAAITAASMGARVALVGHGVIGGTCVNVGCVPSKTMIRAAAALHSGRTASRFPGLSGDAALVDWPALVAGKDELVATLRRSKYVDLLGAYDTIRYVEGRARLADGGLTVDGTKLGAARTVIATGSAPRIPDLAGIDDVPVLTSTTAMELGEIPSSLVVLGGGFAGCELAQMFARLGTAVTLLARTRLLPSAEPEVSDALATHLAAEGVTVRTGLAYRGIARDADGVALSVDDGAAGDVLRASRVLATTGRKPNTADLGLAEAGVRADDAGAVIVDPHMRTTREGVYAAGDVTGRDLFVYMAAYGAKIAARNALDGDRVTYDNAAMPWVVFTDPQVAGVGLGEAAARAAGHDVKTSVLPLSQLPRALAARDTRGLVKLVADRRTDRLLGGQIIAPEGADTIQTLAMALRAGMTAKALGETIFPYLTTVEGLKLAAQTFDMDVAKLSCCAG